MKHHIAQHLRAVAVGLAVLLGAVVAASSARAETSIGLRGGLSIDPDQFLIGLHIQPPAVGRNLYIVPNADVGFGDDIFSLSFNGDLQYQFAGGETVRPYAGGGLSLYYYDVDRGGSDTEFGVNALGGLLFDRRSGPPVFLEMKLGLTDRTPDWKFLVGLMFR
jgi:hypothetical protein